MNRMGALVRHLRNRSWHGRPAHEKRAGCPCRTGKQRVLQEPLGVIGHRIIPAPPEVCRGSEWRETMKKLLTLTCSLTFAFAAFAVHAARTEALTFTWSGAGTANQDGSLNWTDPANWSASDASTIHYPGSDDVTADIAVFPDNTAAQIAFTGRIELGGFDVAHGGLDLVITGSGDASLTLTTYIPFGSDNPATPAAIIFKAMELITTGPLRVLKETTLAFREGCRHRCPSGISYANSDDAVIEYTDSLRDGGRLEFGGNATMIINNSTVMFNEMFYHTVNNPDVVARIIFKGQHPLLYPKGTYMGHASHEGVTQFVFEVPEGGYDAPPLQSGGTWFGSDKAGQSVVVIAPASPALSAGTLTEADLAFGWTGCGRARVALTPESNVSYAYLQSDRATAATSDATAQYLRASIGTGNAAATNATCWQILPTKGVFHNISHKSCPITGYVFHPVPDTTAIYTVFFGTENDNAACTMQAPETAVTAQSTPSVTWVAPECEKDYYFFMRVITRDLGGNVVGVSDSALMKVHTLDASKYTWIGGSTGFWDDPANWSSDKGTDCIGYPNSTASAVCFPEGCRATIHLRGPIKARPQFTNPNLAVTITPVAGLDRADCPLACGNITMNSACINSHIVFDNTIVTCSNGGLTPYATTTVTLRNTDWRQSNAECKHYYGGRIECVDDTSFTITDNALRMCGDSVFVLSNSTVTAEHTFQLGGGGTAGGHVIFQGERPLLYIRQNNSSQPFNNGSATMGASFDFEIPAGGYASAPVQCYSSRTIAFMSGSLSPLTINVTADRQAIAALNGTTQPLVAWTSCGIATNLVAPVAADSDLTIAPGTEDPPATLGVAISRQSHAGRLIVSGAPIQFAAQIAPAYGTHEITAVTDCTAPAGLVTLGTYRATCTGYRLYNIDPDTGARLEVAGSPFATTTYTAQPTDPWREIVWQWNVEEYAATVSQDGADFAPHVEWRPYGATAQYDIPATATASQLQAVLDAAPDGAVINLAEGTYALEAPLTVARGITLKGAGRDRTILAATADFSPAITIDDADAVVERLTIKDVIRDTTSPSYKPTGVLITGNGGTLREARVWNCYDKHLGNVYGAVKSEGSRGRISRCVIDGNRNVGNGSACGGVFLAGGVLENSLITNNSAWATANLRSGGVYAAGWSRVLNCTVMYNTFIPMGSYATGGSVQVVGGLVRNTIIAGNVISGKGDANLYGDTNAFAYCLSPDPFPAVTRGNITAVPQFDAKRPLYLARRSPGVNAGSTGEFPELLAMTDLFGLPRVKHVTAKGGTMIDIGCTESTYRPAVSMFILR